MQGELKRLQAEIKRLKKTGNLDKEEIEYDTNGNDASENMIPCNLCKIGFMAIIEVVGRNFYKCGSCGRTRKV